MRRTVMVIAIAILVLFLAAPAASANVSLTKPERQLLALVNHVRVNHKLPALKINAKLERAARSHSREMVAKDYFDHNSFNGETFSHRLIRFGYTTSGCTYWQVGECIAYGAGAYGSPKITFRNWMNSPEHRKIILTKSVRQVGMGRASGAYKSTTGCVFFTLDVGVRRH
jgi:uncharacterized protein YkwD